jgi:hypothetical protein
MSASAVMSTSAESWLWHSFVMWSGGSPMGLLGLL